MPKSMNHLAKAVVAAYAFLELSGDEVVDPDASVEAMEMLTAELRECSAEERRALEDAVSAELAERKDAGASTETLLFYENFIDNLFADE